MLSDDGLLMLRQALLFGHLLAFAMAISTVLRTDLALWRARGVDAAHIDAAASLLKPVLIALWASGLALVACDAGAVGAGWRVSDKLAAKLLVVLALTLNGVALHTLALPALRRHGSTHGIGWLPLLLGATSTASWLFASFVGVSRVLAPLLDLREYLLLYAAALALALAVTALAVRPHLAARASGG